MGGGSQDYAPISARAFPVPLEPGILCKVSGAKCPAGFLCGPLEWRGGAAATGGRVRGGGGLGGLPRPSQHHHVSETGNPGALRRTCVSCLFSNASSSEAMFLLKPLKELRAKRKGTPVCLSACARVRALPNSCL